MIGQKSKRTGVFALLCGLFLLFFQGAPLLRELTAKGLRTFLFVLPSVFLSLVLSGLFLSTGAAGALSRRFGGAFEYLYRMPRAAFSALLLGLAAGFPVGAKCSAQLYAEGQLTREEAERLAAFSDFCSPAFLSAGVGYAVFGSLRAGWALYLLQTLFALVFGFFYKRPKKAPCPGALCPQKDKPFLQAFTASVSSSAEQALKIGGYILFFTLLSGTLGELAARFLPVPGEWTSLFSGFWELSSGVAALKKNAPDALSYAGLISGFSGVSVLMQCASFLRERDLRARGLLIAHILCALFLFCAGKCSFFFF